MLAFYAGNFNCVEINNSFYRLPDLETFRKWGNTVPEGFAFAVKASRYLTHMKKLKDPSEALKKLLECARGLGPKLGPVLFQLPPRWHCNAERLQDFLGEMPPDVRCAFEFRDKSWFNERVYDILQDAGAAFCIHDLGGELSPVVVTADFIYVRFHGPGAAYQGKYQVEALRLWAERLAGWNAQGREVFCFFNNDENAYAVANALELKRIVEEVSC
ncbi:MAG: DUF72 domain-containing protein [Deltaproteobacteria bacterium]|nr:DUF72 domain-containing protein [Deltaproteobacteria bacterium]